MRVAIIGAGIAGLTAAWLLAERHDVTVYEARDRTGGNVHTVEAAHGGRRHKLDAGAQHLSPAAFPVHRALRRELGLDQHSESAFPLHATVYQRGSHAPHLATPDAGRDRARGREPVGGAAAQGFEAFLQTCAEATAQDGDSVSVSEVADRARTAPEVRDLVVLPWIASFCGCDTDQAARMPARTAAAWALDTPPPSPDSSPTWVNLEGGLGTLVDRLVDALHRSPRTGCRITALEPSERGPVVHTPGESATFDRAVVATPAFAAQTLLSAVDDTRADNLRHFEYARVTVHLHGDPRLMPQQRQHWSSVNIEAHGRWGETTSWFGPSAGIDVFKSWTTHRTAPDNILHREEFDQLVPTLPAVQARRRLNASQGTRGVYLAGAYMGGLDSQESAVRSALAVGRTIDPGNPRLARLEGDT